MRIISDLNKEEKLLELTLDMQTKQSMGQIMGSQNPMYVSDQEVEDLLEDVIDNIWYISVSPNFDFEGKFLATDSFKIESKDDMNDMFNNNKNKVFIWYNLLLNNEVLPGHPQINLTINGNQSYMLRGKFVDNLQNIRNEKINTILNEK